MSKKDYFSKNIVTENSESIKIRTVEFDEELFNKEIALNQDSSDGKVEYNDFLDFEKANAKITKPLNLKLQNNSIIKYSNDIDISGIGDLNALEHDIFNTIMLSIVEAKSNKIKVPLANIKKILKMSKKSNLDTVKYLNDVFMKFVLILKQNTIKLKTNKNEALLLSRLLVAEYQVCCNDDEAYIFFELNKDMEKLFYDIKSTFAQVMATDILSVKGKYSKALCHILARYFKGDVWLDIDDFRENMGFSYKYKHSSLCRELDKAINILIKQNMYQFINYEFEYGCGRGRPAIKIHLTFKKTLDYDAKLHGQMTLEEGTTKDTNPKNIAAPRTEEDVKKYYDFKLLSNIKCPKCNGKVYARHCKKEGKHQGEIQLFCVNNEHYHKYLKDLDGKGTCNWTDYQSEKAVDLNNTTDKIVSKIVNNANGFDAEGTRKEINNYHDYAFEPKTTINTPIKSMSKLDKLISNSNLSPRLKYWLSYSDNDILYVSTLKDNKTISKINENEAKIIIEEKRRLGIPEVIPKEWR